jgi:hypothetical protein
MPLPIILGEVVGLYMSQHRRHGNRAVAPFVIEAEGEVIVLDIFIAGVPLLLCQYTSRQPALADKLTMLRRPPPR